MRTKKELEIERRQIYRCELTNCPYCDERLKALNQVNGRKTVQKLSEVLWIGYRPYECKNPCCQGNRFGSSEWNQIAPKACTYGYDVIGQIGWERQTYHRTFGEIHKDLSARIQISEKQVSYLYHERYLPLLACHERIKWPELRELSERAGLMLTMDGLAPEGGEAQLWLIRELQSNLTLRSGYLSRQDQATFENFLSPITKHGLKVSYVMSDKQRGLLPAIGSTFGTETKHILCQSHYLNNLSEPLSAADETMKVTLRKAVRSEVGELIRQEEVESPGVLTVTGLIPTPIGEPTNEKTGLMDPSIIELPKPTNAASEEASHQDKWQSITDAMIRRVRYLLTLKGRPPFGLAGIEMVQRLVDVVTFLDSMINHIPDARLQQLRNGIYLALSQVQQEFSTLSLAAQWLRHIANLLDPDIHPDRSGDDVKNSLFSFLDSITSQTYDDPFLNSFSAHLLKVSNSYSSGLFYSYDEPALPRSNNDRESEFRSLNHRLIRTHGQAGAVRRTVQRTGAWELIPRPDSLSDTVSALAAVNTADFELERQRLLRHRQRFRMHSRHHALVHRQLNQLLEEWLRIDPELLPCA